MTHCSRRIKVVWLFMCGLFTTFSAVTSCSTTKTVGLYCQERQIEIYVDDEYLGRDLVYYTIPKDREYIEVSCRDKGTELYHRRINIRKAKGTLIELTIPKHYKYSDTKY